jgi:fermentation-respiration switch protein FrsA (DUF1100 family)
VQGVAPSIAAFTHSTYQDVHIRAADGCELHAWLFLPDRPHPNYVITMHGVADTRAGLHRIIQMLLRNGYAVLSPDSRAHGESEGDTITYGVREAPDVHAWADYLFSTQKVTNLYGLGESMGAAVLLQSLAVEPRFEAVAAECSFSSFGAIAHDRIYQAFQTDALPIRALAGPIIFTGLTYTRLRYRIDLEAASPIDAVRHTTTPIILIHGLRDTNIYPQHSRDLLMANPQHITPWFVPKAGHTGAFNADPSVFEQRVTTFFQSHTR